MNTLVPIGWEEIKLGEVFAERTSRAGEEEHELLAVTMANGVVKRDEVDIKDNSSDDKSNYKQVKINDIAYNTMRMWQGASGVSKYNGIVSPAYTIVYLKKDYDIDFFGYLFKTHRVIFDFYRYSQGLTSDTWNIKYPHFSKVKVKIPTNKEEQSKIVNIFLLLDNAIENQKKLIKEKEQLKKGLMQNLLSGKIRFDGFSDKCQEIKLGEVFAERTSRAGEEEHELLAVTMANGVVKRDEVDIKDNSSDDKSNYKQVKINDIAYNTMRMWQGASGVSKYNGIVSPAYTIVYLKKDYDIDFFGYLFKTHRVIFDFYRYSQGLTSDTWNIKYPHFSKVKVKIPTNKEEQSKIVEVLKKSEEEINLLKNELEELKLQKKALMQKLLTEEVRVKL